MRSRTDEEKQKIEEEFQAKAAKLREQYKIEPGQTTIERAQDAAEKKLQETQNALMESLGFDVKQQDESTQDNTKALENLDRQMEDLQKALGEFEGINLDFTKKQTGGPITVPGSGSGDKVPMMLPSGSFVLNRNASKFLKRQTGGMVPTMLEPGELVYLNENIKRFQSGGNVESLSENVISNPKKSVRHVATTDALNLENNKVQKFKSGGMVPTMLEPSENVISNPKKSVRHVATTDALNLENNKVQKFKSGGMVPTVGAK